MNGILAVVAICLLGGAAESRAENAAARAARHFRDGIDQSARGKTDKAVEAYGLAAAALPHWYLPYLERAALRLKTNGDLDAVFADLTRVVELKPDALEGYFFLGVAELRAKRPRAAVAQFERVLSIRGDHAHAKAELARARVSVSRLDDEEAAARRQGEKTRAKGARISGQPKLPKPAVAVEPLVRSECESTPVAEQALNPPTLPAPVTLVDRRARAEEALAYVQRAAKCLGRRRIDDAAFAYARAAMLLPHWVVPHAALADLLLEYDRSPERAEDALRQVLRLKPDAPNLDYQRALVAERRGRLDEARDRYRELIRKRAGDANFVRHIEERLMIVETARGFENDFEVGERPTIESRGGPTEIEDGLPVAEAALAPAANAAERQARARDARAAFLAAQDIIRKSPANAVPLLRRAAILAPAWALPRIELGILLKTLNIAPRRAEAELLHALRLAPNATAAHRAIARIFDATNRAAAAYAHFKKAHTLDPTDTHTAFRLALIELSRGARDEALKYFEQLVRLEPSNVVGWSNIASLNEAAHRLPDAERAFLAAIRLAPRSPAVHLELGRFYERIGERAKASRAFAEAKRLQPAPPPRIKKRILRPLR